MEKVPLVIYTRGERVVVGEASVATKDGDLVVEGVVFEKHIAELKDTSEYSLGVTHRVGLPAAPTEVAVIPPLKVKED